MSDDDVVLTSVDDEEPVELVETDEPFPEPSWEAPDDAGDPEGADFSNEESD